MAGPILDSFSAEASQAFAYGTIDDSCLSFGLMDPGAGSLTVDSPVPENISTDHTLKSVLRPRSRGSGMSSTTSVNQAPSSRRSIRPSNESDPVDYRFSSTGSFFDRPESAARSFMGRSRRALKHHGSKLSLSSLSSLDEPQRPRPRFLTLQGGHRRWPSRSKDSTSAQGMLAAVDLSWCH
jgi:hypothetical protein